MQTKPIEISEPGPVDAVDIAEGAHIVGEFVGDALGPTVLVVGSIHGNEPSGLLAMRKIAPALQKLESRLKGRIFLIAGNTRALRRGVRYIDADLNRHWTPETIELNSPSSGIRTNRAEDAEQRELLEIFDRVFGTAKDEVYALDLHSTSAESTPFAMIGDTLRNREFARKFPATILLGIEEQLNSTILEYINNLGAITLGFEAGEHQQKTAVDNQEALVWLALYNSGCLSENDVDLERHEKTLREAMGRPRIIEIRHRHAIKKGDDFEMDPGFENFDPVRRGQILAHDKGGEVKARETGMILMPLYQKLGDDGFFLGREISPFWLSVSRVLRKMGVGGLMFLLPGVSRHPFEEQSLIVNTNVARIFPLQIFHLLGFRKEIWKAGKLVVSRRKHDTDSPFAKSDGV